MDPTLDGTLFYGDCLDILRNRDLKGDRYIPDDSVDLIYLDPPFNSDRIYNVIFKEPNGHGAAGQIKGFSDTWTWNDNVAKEYEEIKEQGGKIADTMVGLEKILGFSNMFAYLVMMSSRLIEMRRVLKSTGSIYLHCDTTSSHYIKIVMDAIFGVKSFRNDIIWKRTYAHNDPKQFGRNADRILFYVKENKYTFNTIFVDYDPKYIKDFFKHQDEKGQYQLVVLTGPKVSKGESNNEWKGYRPSMSGRSWSVPKRIVNRLVGKEKAEQMSIIERLDLLYENDYIIIGKKGIPRFKEYLHEMDGAPAQEIWNDLPVLSSQSSERLGYPTQKPEALLDRIIRASSNEGDVVLDPFCGCGTSVSVAQKLKRKWIGIDITAIAITIMKNRLITAFPDVKFKVIGEPTTPEDARRLAESDDPEARYQFQLWALGLDNARPIGEIKKGADKGVDGKRYFDTPDGTQMIVYSVKSGGVTAKDVRDLGRVVDREKAAIGVLISMEPITKPMKTEASTMGYYRPSGLSEETYPKIQLYTIGDLMKGEKVKWPRYLKDVTFKAAPKGEKGSVKTEEPGLQKWS